MNLPSEVPVMILPQATLFPQALLPLYIFEPRYRRMLSDMLQSDRMFIVAMQKPGSTRETPCPIAGLGLIRVSVAHQDGTSHLILQGLTRVKLQQTIRYKPYRIQQICPVIPPPADQTQIKSLQDNVLLLVRQRMELGGLPLPMPLVPKNKPGQKALAPESLTDDSPPPKKMTAQAIIQYLESLKEPDQVADLVACAVLQNPLARQIILENVDLEERLKNLIHFLSIDINKLRKGGNP